jgi:type IV secretory pathway TraG/TraD family ATPase VirD4
VCTALTASIVEAARSRALAERDGRLKPPLLLALDEAVNVAPIPRLDQLLSTGGGSGIQTMVVVQSMAAARNVWGKEMGDALQDFNNAKIVLGGLADAQDLKDISDQLGMRDEMVTQASRRAGALFVPSDYSHSWRQVPVMTPAEVRMIRSAAEDGRHALLIARDSPGVMFQLAPIYERRRQENSGNPLPQRGRVPTMDRTRRQQ